MSKKALYLGFCLAVLAALTTLPAPAVPAPSYSQTGTGGTMALACSNAVQKIKNNCDLHGTITTTQGSCQPLHDFNGNVIGYVCTCTATASYCVNFIDPQL